MAAASIPLPPSLAQAMILSASAPLLLLDEQLLVVAVSLTFCRAFEVDARTAVGRSVMALGRGEWDTPRLRSLLTATVGGGAEIEAYEIDLATPGRGPRRLVLNAHKLAYDDRDGVRLLLAAVDITDERARDQLRDDLANDNAVLMREMEHRIANSLQIVASVLMQGARKAASDETRIHLTDAHHRVMSIAAVQRQLSVSSRGDVELQAYLNQLCTSIGASMIHDHRQLQLRVTVDARPVAAAVSVSLGLIVTELIINALKHAFPGGRPGAITVDYAGNGGDWTLTVSDDGVGMAVRPEAAAAGLGTAIVRVLAKQLRAEIVVSAGAPGTVIRISHRTAARPGKIEPAMAAV